MRCLTLLTLSLVLAASPVRGECILDLPLNEGSGVPADKSVFNRKIEMTGARWIEAKSGSALEFDGLNTRVSIDSRNLTVQNITVSFRVDPYVTTNIGRESIIKGPDGNGYDAGYRFLMQNKAGVKDVILEMNFGDEWPRTFRFGTIPVNQFTHLAVTYNHQEVVLYKNGEKLGSFPETRDIFYWHSKPRTTSGSLFMEIGAAHEILFKGIITGVKVFDGALSAPAIKELTTKEPAPVIKQDTKPEDNPGNDGSYYPTDKLNSPRYGLCRNLIQNPSFEAGWRYWQACALDPFRNKCALDSQVAFSGKKSLRLYGYKGERESVVILSFAIPVKTGKEYTLSFYGRGDPGQKIVVRVETGDWPVFPLTRLVELTSEWKRYSFTFTAPNLIACPTFWLGTYPAQDGQGWIDAVQLEEGTQATGYTEKPLVAELVTDHANNLFQPGEKIDARLEIHTRPGQKGIVDLSLKDFFGTGILSRKYPFESDKEGFASLPIALQEDMASGLYIVRTDFELSNDYKDYDFFRIGVMKYLENKHKHKNMFAICAPNVFPDADAAYREMKQIGMGSQVPFSFVPNPEVTKIAEKNNVLTLTSIFCQGKISYADDGTDPRADKNAMNVESDFMTDKVDFAKVATNAYRLAKTHPEIKYWKLVNEPLCPRNKPEEMRKFMEMLRGTVKSIKEANPKAVIISVDLTNMYPQNGILDMEAFIEAGMLEICDIIAIHPYRPRPETPDLDADTAVFLAMLAKHGYQGDVWFTEGLSYTFYNIPAYGLDTTVTSDFWRGRPLSYDLGLGEKLAAAYNARSWLVALKYGTRVKMLADWQHNSYILDGNRTPRAFNWVPNILGNILGNADYRQDIDVTDTIRGYLFEDEKKQPVAVFWNTDEKVDRETAKPISLVLPFKSGEIELIDFMGARLELEPTADIAMTAYPLFVRGKKNTLASFTRQLQGLRVRGGGLTVVKTLVKVIDGDKLEVGLMNNTSSPIKGKISIESEGKSLLNTDIILKDKNRENVTVTLPKPTQGLQEIPLKVSFLAEGQSQPQVTDTSFKYLPAHKRQGPITIDGDLSDWPERYRIVLPDVFKEFPVSPALRAKFPEPPAWKGRDDLSAALYSAWDEDYLYLALEVKDDVFFPLPEGTDVGAHYLYDSLQLYFDTFGDAREQLPRTGYDNNDYNYNVYYAGNKALVSAYVVPEWQLAFLKSGPAADVKAAFKKATGGMVYELALPANRVRPIVLEPGTSFGFALLINDNDGDYRKRGLTLTPEGTEPYMNPHFYPVMILKEE